MNRKDSLVAIDSVFEESTTKITGHWAEVPLRSSGLVVLILAHT